MTEEDLIKRVPPDAPLWGSIMAMQRTVNP